MTANEIRIGSIVTVDNPKYHPQLKDVPLKVNGISPNCNVDGTPTYSVNLMQMESRMEYSQFINFIKPIPLTDEILLKCGFEKDDTGVDMFEPDYYEWYQKEFPVIDELCQSSDKSYLFDTNTDTLRIRYLHELQNLHYALCGKELEVEL